MASGPRNDDIAIVGLACRFPGGASNETKLWDLLSNRESAFTEVPPERFNVDAYHHPSPNKLNTLNSRGAHFMHEDVSAFDAPFFGITAQEANAMDPAARMLLELTFEALESAGQKLEDVAGSDTSCYVGCFTRDYHEMLYRDIESAPMYTGTGTGFSLFSNRISWFYDFRGPSMTLDTACSSSLVGLHLACRGLQAGESKMAVVCGANVILSPDIALTLSNLHMLSMDGLSRSFAEGTTGYGRGEGIASLILKRVEDALRDGDPIRAVIRGSGVNQDGHTKGITVPSSEAQADLIQTVYSSAGLDPSETGYFEAHGTGTAVGDPLELGAIAKSISKSRKVENKLVVGSIKSNIGHLEGAAGLAGVIKSVLMVEKNAILPNIHFEKPNRRIPFEQWKIKIPTELMPWPASGVRRASVNSFGYGGTNAHVILDDAESYLQKRLSNGHSEENGMELLKETRIFLLSARDEASLERLKQVYSDYIADVAGRRSPDNLFDESAYLDGLAYTLGCRRSVFPCRSFITASTLSELQESLSVQRLISTKAATSSRLGFVFTGQGAQWARMGLVLMDYPVFAQSIQEADRYLSEELRSSWSVLEELGKDAEHSQIGLAEFSQPLCTILQVALVDLLTSWQILPATVVGHSSGEIAAAYSFGAITKQDAWKISYWRGQLCAQLPLKRPELRGAMMAVGLGREEALSYIEKTGNGQAVIACVNSPSSVTLSGDETAINDIESALQAQNIFARKLNVQNAYHSHHMQPLADEYLAALEGLSTLSQEKAGTVKMASSVTGALINHTDLGPSYWVQNLVSPVLFSNAVEALLKQSTKGRRQARANEPAFDYLVEIGPHAALKGPLRQILQAHEASQIPYSSVLMRGEDGPVAALSAAGDLVCRGIQVDIKAVNRFQGRAIPLTNLPTYPWNHSLKYWADSRVSRARQHRKYGRHDLLGAPTQDSDELEPRWRHFLRVSDNPWIQDHIVHSSILYPGSGILAMPLHALQTLADSHRDVESIGLRDVSIVKAIVVPDDQFGLEVFLRMRRQRPRNGTWNGWWEFSVCSNQENDHVEEHGFGLGKIHYRPEKDTSVKTATNHVNDEFEREFDEVQATSTASISPVDFYAVAKSVGLTYGPSFQGLTEINAGNAKCSWKIQVPDTQKIMPAGVESPHIVHPTTLDIVFHSLFAAIGDGHLDMQHAAVPIGLKSMKISVDLPTGGNTFLKGISKVSRDAGRDIVADIRVAAESSNTPSIIVEGLRCRELPNGNSQSGPSETIKAPIGHVVQKIDVDLIEPIQLAQHIQKRFLERKEDGTLASEDLGEAIITIVDLVAHKNPRSSLLQVGGVTPELTQRILSNLEADNVSAKRFKNIKVVDANQELISQLETQYATPAGTVQFEKVTLDEAQSLAELKESSIDLAIVNIEELHSDKVSEYLANVLRSLKPGGKVLKIDSAGRNGAIGASDTLSFDTLCAGPEHVLSFATKGTAEKANTENFRTVILLPRCPSENVKKVASALEQVITVKGAIDTVIWSAEMPSLENSSTVISLLEFDDAFVADLSEEDFSSLKTLALGVKRILWVAHGTDPQMQTAAGWLRSLSNENMGIDYCYLLLESATDQEALDVAKLIERVSSTEEMEREYTERDDGLCCSRWAAKTELSALVGADSDQSKDATMRLGEARHGLTLTGKRGKLPSDARFTSVDVLDQNLTENEVMIDVRSVLLSTNDVQGTGQTGWREAAGVVVATGTAGSFEVGTAVSFVYDGPISTKAKINSKYCSTLSGTPEFQDALLQSVTYPTVYHGLCTLGQLRCDKTIFVQGGSSILGQAAISLARRLGATVFASVRDEEQNSILQRLGVPSDKILNDNVCERSSIIKRVNEGRGFDVIFNATGDEETIAELWQCIARGGKFINADANKKDTPATFNLSAKPFTMGASFEIIDMNEYLTNDFSTYQSIRDESESFRTRCSAVGLQIPVFTAGNIHEALDSVHVPTGLGKAVLLFSPDSKIPVSPDVKNQLRLRPDATYVLAGGLGGLGRSLAKLMVGSGARHLAFLSRSGPGSAAAQSISEEFSPLGVTVNFYGCDVADSESVSHTFGNIAKNQALPPIRGIIQSAAVLRDSIFENMSHTQWTEAVRPKVQGSWNLHQASLSGPCAKEGLDFFVMLASISGFVGNRGQANYAGGNSFQDALAKYRKSLGLAATSVDLGLMQDIGLIAERGGQSNLSDDTVVPLTAKDFELIFKLAMNSEGHDVPAQIVTGLPTGGILQKQGIETLPFYYRDPRFSAMQFMDLDETLTSAGGSAGNESVSMEEQLASAKSREQANGIVLEALRAQVAKALRCPAEDIDTARPLHYYGMDSLMAVDMRGWVQGKLKAEISLFDVMSGSSISALAEKISKASKLIKAELE
uniref:Highly reducing polyketide synthase Preu1 n=1 Tax=Preussia isomera TaxID=325670 RepID=PREU1_PREIS|nr:RecName: Full=Highly reducing polyketide synthase Preu1; AltName: Full=biosynthesis protein Preu1 [Preussia isomera]UNY67713.1 polyketide synthase Preu1 [Preussia isomera]